MSKFPSKTTPFKHTSCHLSHEWKLPNCILKTICNKKEVYPLKQLSQSFSIAIFCLKLKYVPWISRDLSLFFQVITASSSVAEKGGLLERLGYQTNTAQKRGVRFEGIRFSLYDFSAYIAQATDSGGSREFLGIIVETEYLPIRSINTAQHVLKVSNLCTVNLPRIEVVKSFLSILMPSLSASSQMTNYRPFKWFWFLYDLKEGCACSTKTPLLLSRFMSWIIWTHLSTKVLYALIWW